MGEKTQTVQNIYQRPSSKYTAHLRRKKKACHLQYTVCVAWIFEIIDVSIIIDTHSVNVGSDQKLLFHPDEYNIMFESLFQ